MKRRTLLMSSSILSAAFAAQAVSAETTDNPLTQTDPDFSAIEQYLLKVEMPKAGQMPVKTRCMVTLATLTTVGGLSRFAEATEEALKASMSTVEIKETLYQCAPYIGISRVETAHEAVNAALIALGQNPTPASQSTVNENNRFEKGLAVQKSIFGAAIDKMHASTPKELEYINKQALTGYCFGDFYTRKGLDLKARELITFTAIMCLGGCEPQLRAHTGGNLSVGNTRQDLIDTIMVAMPYIGFPRTLNALAVVNEIAK